MLHVFIIDYQAKIACIWDLDAKVDTFLGKNGDTILQYEKQDICTISELCKGKVRPEKDLRKGCKDDDLNKVGQTKKKMEFWNHDK